MFNVPASQTTDKLLLNSINKIQLKSDGEKEIDLISVSQALQIAGRAGRFVLQSFEFLISLNFKFRFNTKWETGYVTTFHQEELHVLADLLKQTPEDILQVLCSAYEHFNSFFSFQAGLHPTFDQLEMYAYHLPAATLANLVDIFISLSTLDDSMYTLCHLDDFKFLADMIEHIKLPLKAKYTFCCAPINRKMPFVCTMFLKMARQYSKGEIISFDWLCGQVGWPFSPPETLLDLVHLEAVHDVFDLYLWLSYRFPDMFPDVDIVRQVQQELDKVVEEGIAELVKLLKNSESPVSRRTGMVDEDRMEAKSRIVKRLRGTWTHEDANMAGRQKEVKSIDFGPTSKSDRATTLQGELAKAKSSKARGKLTKRLLEEGLVTKEQMQQLKRELKDDNE